MKRVLLGVVLTGMASVGFAEQPLVINKGMPPATSSSQSESKLSPRLQALKDSLSKDGDSTFLGVELGKKISIEECEKHKIGKKMIYTHVAKESACIEYPEFKDGRAPNYYRANIVFPIKDTLLRMSGSSAMAVVVDGKIEGLSFSTNGLSVQKYLFAELQEKYGKPTQLIPQTRMNGFGAKFETISALWMFSNMVVNYESVVNKIDTGSVDIYTNIGAKERSAELKKVLGTQRAL